MFYLSPQCQMCHYFKIFWPAHLNFLCLELIPIRIGRSWIGMPWIPIPIRIADLTRSGSGSTTLDRTTVGVFRIHISILSVFSICRLLAKYGS
jgi:hypothetical protein